MRTVVSTSNDEASLFKVDIIAVELAVLSLEKEQQKLIKKLEARVERLKRMNAQIKEDSQEEQEKLKSLMNCVVCLNVLQDPQLLECGHSMCRSCLRPWWEASDAEKGSFLTPKAHGGWHGQPFVLWTEAHDEDPVGLVYNLPIPPPKLCPYCKTIITRRPAPNPILDNMFNIVRSRSRDLPPIPANKVGLWRDIFRSQRDVDDAKKNEVQRIREELEEGLILCHQEFQQLHRNITRMVKLIPIVKREREALRDQLESP